MENRKYKYKWTEHTMIRETINWPKVKIMEGKSFTSCLNKRIFSWTQFEDMWIVDETKNKVQDKSLNKKDLAKQYKEKFWKNPFGWRSAEEIEAKL